MALLLALFSMTPTVGAVGTDAAAWVDRSSPIFRLIASQKVDDGLPYTPDIFSIAQDGTGFLWFGTLHGLQRWDGYRMRTYTVHAGETCSLQDERVSTVFVDELKQLWLGTIRGDVARYDPETDCIRTVAGASDTLDRAPVESFASDGAGGLWIGSSKGMLHLASNHTQITRLPTDESDQGLSHVRVSRVLRDRLGSLWAGGDSGLVRRSPSDAHFVRIDLPADAKVRGLIQSADGRIWVGTTDSGAFVIEPTTMRIRAVSNPSRAHPLSEIRRIAETPSGQIWLATATDGILVIDPVSLLTQVIHHQKGVTQTLNDDGLDDILCDRQGLLWVATDAGLGYFNTSRDIATILTAAESTGLPEGLISSMERMRDGRIAIAIRDQIALIGPQKSKTEIVPLVLPSGTQYATSLATLNGRDLFVGVQPSGLAWIDRAHGQTYSVQLPGPNVSRHVISMLADGERLWVGALEGLWLVVHDPNAASSPNPWKVTEHYAVDGIEAMATAPDDLRWFGSARGIYRYQGSASPPRYVPILDSAGAPLPDLFVSSLRVDRRGRLWVGSASQGLIVIDPRSQTSDQLRVLRHFRAELPDGPVNTIVEDDRGMMWVGSDRGLARIDPESFSIERLGRGDGVALSDYRSAACATETCDQLLFGGHDGLTLIHPDRPTSAPLPPPVVITQISVGHREVPSARFNTSRTDQILEVPAHSQGVAVEFAALDYSDPALNVYQYRLEGYDSDWVMTKFGTRMAEYTNLAPGTYRLRLRGTDHAGVWSVNERRLSIRVAPAWYEMMWFHVVEAAGLLLAVSLIVQTRTRWLRVRQSELEALVDERTRALAQVTEARNSLIENLAHDLRTPLTSLQGYLDRLNLNDDALSEVERRRYIGIAVRQAGRVIRLVRELFELVRLDDPQALLAFERFSPVEILQDVAQEFGSIAEGRSIDFEIDPGVESVQIVGDISLFQRLIDNLVDNAKRHTPASGKIRVKLGMEVGVIVLEVRDTGRGIKSADRERIFNRYERGDAKERVAGAGLGLAIVKRILELHGGTIVVDSEEGAGTWFTVRLPLAGPMSATSSDS